MSKLRTFSYYRIYLTDESTTSTNATFDEIFSTIDELSLADRKRYMANTKFGGVTNIFRPGDGNLMRFVFKSAKLGFRPNIVNSRDFSERENGKSLREGDLNKNHVVVRYTQGRTILLFEHNRDGIKIDDLISYINQFLNFDDETIRFAYNLIVDNDINDKIDSMIRVSKLELLVSKTILGSSALNYSQRMSDVQNDVKVIIPAERNRDIREVLSDLLNVMTGRSAQINQIEIEGKGENGLIKFNTNQIIRKEKFSVPLIPATGEIDTAGTFPLMEARINEY